MNRCFGVLLLLIHLGPGRGLVCPLPYKDILGICLHFPATNMTFCDANAYCSSVGGELIRGANYLPFSGRTFPGAPKFFYIGLTDLLVERRSNRTGWRWNDGALTPASENLTWGNKQPGSSGGASDALMDNYGSLMNVGLYANPSRRAVPMCQMRSARISNKQSHRFSHAAIPVGLLGIDAANRGGCVLTKFDVASKLTCASACSKEIDCAAFYFSQPARECRLVLYTDVSLKMATAVGWSKFVKRNV